MSFVIQRVTGGATTMQQIATDVLHIGRGTNCELRSDNPAVALLHAEIRAGLREYTIIDKGSITGTYVNGEPVDFKTLSRADEIEIGDLRIEVQLADPTKPMFLRVSTLPAGATEGPQVAGGDVEQEPASIGPTLRAEKIDYAAAYGLQRPYITRVAIASVLLIAALLVVNELLRPERQSWVMPGPLSSAHSLARDANGDSIANNCNACHEPWRSVSNVKCTACHGRAPHAERQIEAPACIFCHTEHRGQPRLALIADARCLSCHADLARHVKGTAPPVVAHISAFGVDHPEFHPIADPALLRFTHKKHLRGSGVANNEGKKEKLTCESCHKLVSTGNTIDPAPIDFNRDCHRCHALTFDEALPATEVPHGGNPNLVYGFITMTYTNAGAQDAMTRGIQAADSVLNTTCRQCHKIEKHGERMAAVPPVLPTIWLPHAQFSHTSHRNIDCESCHKNARTSTKASDVLIPQQETCVRCHAPQTVKVATTCATCHAYHERSKLLVASAAGSARSSGAPPSSPTRATQMLQTVLLYAIVILLLVILVPVGFAFYRYLIARIERPRAASEAAPAQRQTPPPVPPQPEPAPQPAVAKDETRVAPLEGEPAAAATEMIQWFGMLHCTTGPLAGQRFMIPEEGLWIGRDASLSQVVINDARVSKRHVRIIPRSGRVHAIDTESRNGTFIDKIGERLSDVELKRGNTIILADNVAAFRYEI